MSRPRVVVVGATGNIGTSLLRAFAEAGQVDVTAVARRLPTPAARRALGAETWAAADIARDHLVPVFRGADVVVHLAWLIQPSRDQATLRRVNVHGSRRVFEAVAAAGVGSLVYASSVGAYSRGPSKASESTRAGRRTASLRATTQRRKRRSSGSSIASSGSSRNFEWSG